MLTVLPSLSKKTLLSTAGFLVLGMMVVAIDVANGHRKDWAGGVDVLGAIVLLGGAASVFIAAAAFISKDDQHSGAARTVLAVGGGLIAGAIWLVISLTLLVWFQLSIGGSL
jgi:hypothetical protein